VLSKFQVHLFLPLVVSSSALPQRAESLVPRLIQVDGV
jgi:hypothetical protein